MDTSDLISRLQQLKPVLASRGVAHLAIYGSRARGDHSAGSDIDLLVDVAEGSAFNLLELIGVEHVVGDVTGIAAHARMRRSLGLKFAARVRTDTVEVF